MLLEAGMLRWAASGGDGGGSHLDLSTVPRIASGMSAKCDAVTTTMEAMTTTSIPMTAAMRIPTMATLPRAAVGERATNKEVGLGSESPTKDSRVRFAVDMPTAEPTKQDRRAPIKMVGGRAWSPGIYRSLRLLGKSLDVAWERAVIHPLTCI